MAARWANNVLTTCMRLRPGERMLGLVDPPLQAAGEELCAAALKLGADQAECHLLNLTAHPLTVVSRELLHLVSSADVIVSLLSTLDLQREVAPLRAAVAAFRSAERGRWGFGAFIDEDVLHAELTADYREVARVARGLAAKLEGATEVHMTSAAGTDLRLTIAGRPVHMDTGILTEPGSFGNLPAGEVFVAPLEQSAEGQLVVDLSIADLVLAEPVVLTFRSGRVVAVQGGSAAQELERRLLADPWAAVVGEFGLGANPRGRIRGRVTTDEKVLGTAHVALGANTQFGGSNPAASHYDCVIGAPYIRLDGRPL